MTEPVVIAPGQGYKVGDLCGSSTGGGIGAVLFVTQVSDLTGGMISAEMIKGGQGYTTGAAVLNGGSGTGAQVGINAVTIQPPSRILYWLHKAYTNLIYENQFPDTEITYTFNLVQGQDVYPYPSWVRAIQALTLYRTDGTVITCETKDVKYIRRMANFTNQSAPSMWCEFGGSIIFRPIPDQNGPYITDLDVWSKPFISSPLGGTRVMLPEDWNEALDWAATVRGHTAIQEEDKAHAVQALLYGFVDPQTAKFTPGLIQNLQNRIQASRPFKDWGIQPKGATQGYTRRR